MVKKLKKKKRKSMQKMFQNGMKFITRQKRKSDEIWQGEGMVAVTIIHQLLMLNVMKCKNATSISQLVCVVIISR